MRIEPIKPVERIYPIKDATKKHTSDENPKRQNSQKQEHEKKQPEQKGKVLTKRFDVYI